ncbi:hypothetical protein [Ideonella livida]|uniref:Uncharacterized protein n=1 Tax=Ideonella livida TaxID=2707176 RepID=A0A7C9PGD6_9BURK|nr:hypothetical protein [Ideonella livida]NDY91215.1 hypothetical protein [Ideonella livida]
MSWLSVLKVIPWSEVISNAPKMVDTAKKLWRPPEAAASDGRNMATATELGDPGSLAGRLLATEAALAQAVARQDELSGLVKAMAEQSARLVAQVEAQQRRLRWLTWTLLASLGLSLWAVWRLLG